MALRMEKCPRFAPTCCRNWRNSWSETSNCARMARVKGFLLHCFRAPCPWLFVVSFLFVLYVNSFWWSWSYSGKKLNWVLIILCQQKHGIHVQVECLSRFEWRIGTILDVENVWNIYKSNWSCLIFEGHWNGTFESLFDLIYCVDIQKVFRSGPLHPQPRVRFHYFILCLFTVLSYNYMNDEPWYALWIHELVLLNLPSIFPEWVTNSYML